MENKQRIYSLKIYFKDSPSPLYLNNICHIQTEGGLLRLIFKGETSKWWPLENIHTLEEISKETIGV